MRLFPALLLLVLPVLACSSPPPTVTHYLLRADLVESSGRMDAPDRVGLGRLVVAPYLASSDGVVIETGSGTIQAARQHRWAEPMDAGIRALLTTEIGAALGHPLTGSYLDRPDWDQRIDVAIDRMHGTMEGSAVLEARYRIRSASGADAGGDYYFARSKPLPEEGYAGVVAAQAALLRELAIEIAEAVNATRS